MAKRNSTAHGNNVQDLTTMWSAYLSVTESIARFGYQNAFLDVTEDAHGMLILLVHIAQLRKAWVHKKSNSVKALAGALGLQRDGFYSRLRNIGLSMKRVRSASRLDDLLAGNAIVAQHVRRLRDTVNRYKIPIEDDFPEAVFENNRETLDVNKVMGLPS